MADDEAAALEAARRLPLAERVAHRLWRARVDAFDDIAASVLRDGAGDEAGDLLTKGLGEANAAALDKALDGLAAWLRAADERAACRCAIFMHTIAPAACAAIASKGLKQRPATVKRCEDALLLFVELGEGGAVTDALVVALGDRVPKVPAAALDALHAAAAAFGAQALALPALFKALPSAFESKHGPVRDGAKRLAAELGAWLGAGVLGPALLDRLPDGGRKGVEQMLEAEPGHRRPSRQTRAEQRATAAAAAGGAGNAPPTSPSPMDVDGAAADPTPIDAFEFAEPVDVLAGLDKAWWTAVGSAKWSDRRDALRCLAAAAAAPRLVPGDYGDVLRELRKVLTKDANAACVAEAAGALRGLAAGLRRDLSGPARTFVPLLLDKLKDKNGAVAAASGAAAEAMLLQCVALADVGDDIAAALDHKNPKAKAHALRLLGSVAAATPAAAMVKAAPSVLPAVAKATADAAPDVREAALGALAAVCRAVGAAGPGLLDRLAAKGLDEGRRKKVEALVADGSGGGGGGSGGARPGITAARPSAAIAPVGHAASRAAPPGSRARVPLSPNTGGGGGTNTQQPARGRPAPPVAKRPPAKPTDDGDDTGAATLSRSEAEERLASLYGQKVVDGLASGDWKQRLAAVDAMLEAAGNTENGAPPPDGTLVHCLAELPGWGDANFQVLARAFALVEAAAASGGTFGRRDAAAAVPGLADKLADAKLKAPAGAALDAVAEAVGPHAVAGLLHARAAGHRNPKVLAEAVAWVGRAVAEFGLAAFDTGALVSWLKADLGSATPAVRTAAVAALAAVRTQAGPGLAEALRPDIKPALMATLDAAFAAAPPQAAEPTRRVRAGVSGQGGGGARGLPPPARAAVRAPHGQPSARGPPYARPVVDSAAASPSSCAGNPDLLPRTDISAAITPALLARFESAAWTERNAALGDVEDVLRAAGGRVGPDVGGLPVALRARLADTNANLVARALVVAAQLAAAMGPAFDRPGRPLLAPALAALADKKKAVRDGVLTLLTAWEAACPPDRLLPAVAEHVASPRCGADGRAAALAWLAGVAGGAPQGPCLRDLLAAAGVGACDKTAAVRDRGVALAAAVLRAHGKAAAEAAAAGLAGRARDAALDALRRAAATGSFEDVVGPPGGAERVVAEGSGVGGGGVRPAPAVPGTSPGTRPQPLAAAAPPPRPETLTPAVLSPAPAATNAMTPGPSRAAGPRPPAYAAADTPPPIFRIPASVAAVPTPMPPPTPAYTDVDTPGLGAACVRHATSSPSPSPHAARAAWAAALADLASPDLDTAVEGMKLVCYDLMDVASGATPLDDAAALASDADVLVSRLAALVGPAFHLAASRDPGAAARGARACKYALNALMEAFQVQCVAARVTTRPLTAAVAALLTRLLDERLSSLPDGDALLKALNVLMLRVLDGAAPTASLCALLGLLTVPPPADAGAGPDAGPRFADLVVKCLVKLAKALPAGAGSLDLGAVLLAAHAFFVALGPDGVRRRGEAEDRPLRMVKTLVHDLCKLRGRDVRASLDAVLPDAGGPRPLLAAYVDLNLSTLAGTGEGVEGGGQADGGGSAAAVPPALANTEPRAARDEAKARLAAIFRQIGARETSEAGLRALAQFVRAHPDLDLAPHLAKTSVHFRSYIARGVARAGAALDAEAGVGGVGGGLGGREASTGPRAGVPGLPAAAPSPAVPARGPSSAARPADPSPLVPARVTTPAARRASTPSLDELRVRFEQVRLPGVQQHAGPAAAPAAARPLGATPAARPDATSVQALQERMRALRRLSGA